MSSSSKKDMRIRRHFRVRNKVQGTAARPRMAVFRSNKRLEVQFIDDDARLTLAGVSINGKNAEAAKELGTKAAEAAIEPEPKTLVASGLPRRSAGRPSARIASGHSSRFP